MEAYIDHTFIAGSQIPAAQPAATRSHRGDQARRGPRSTDIDTEIRTCLRRLLFRLHLVFRIIERMAAVIERQELIHIATTAHIGLALELKADEQRSTFRLPMLRDTVMLQMTEMLALQEARKRAENGYLAGISSLFPDVARQWESLLWDIQRTAVMADRLVELDGGQTSGDAGTLSTEERIEAWLAELLEVPRIKTLDDLGGDSASFDRARRWLGEAPVRTTAGRV